MLDPSLGFSWTRLSEIEIEKETVCGDRTLQDYWRRSPATNSHRTDEEMEELGELVRDSSGQLWHLMHASPELQKDKISLINDLIDARLAQTKETETDQYCSSQKADGRIQLTGTKLACCSSLFRDFSSPLHIAAEYAEFGPLDWSYLTFGPGATFAGAKFTGDVDLVASKFLGSAWFADADFQQGIHCNSTSFAGHTRFDQARFAGIGANMVGATFADEAWFSGANFAGEAVYLHSTFNGRTVFSESKFFAAAKFTGSSFNYRTDYENALFHDIALFDYVSLGVSGPVSFYNAVFECAATFSLATFSKIHEHFADAFLGTRFQSTVDFTSPTAHWIAALNGAVFEKPLIFARPLDRVADREFFGVTLKAATKVSRGDGEGESDIRLLRTQRLQKVEGACRNLKLTFGKERDEFLEQRFHRFQLIARRRQPHTPISERVFSCLYGITSSYGGSISRPLVGMATIILIFAGAFWLIKGGNLHNLAQVIISAWGGE